VPKPEIPSSLAGAAILDRAMDFSMIVPVDDVSMVRHESRIFSSSPAQCVGLEEDFAMIENVYTTTRKTAAKESQDEALMAHRVLEVKKRASLY